VAKRARLSPFIFIVTALGCLFNASCSSTPSNFHSVALTPDKPLVIAQGTVVHITATVANDSSAAGVTWTAPAHGTLSAITTTSVTYTAPAVAAGQSVSDTVKATSVAFPSQTMSVTFTVEGAPQITTTVLPSATVNGTYNATVNVAGGVPPFVWAVASGALPPNLALSASTTNSVTITGIPTTVGLSAPFTIKAADSNGAAGTSGSLAINIGTLAITTASPLPDGIAAEMYSLQLQASGGVGPYTWTVAAGSTLPSALTLSSGGLLSGIPASGGTTTFNITVTDSEVPAAVLTKNFSLTVVSSSGNNALLNGSYAFLFSGFNATGESIAAGSFTADGSGGIKNGVEDVNSTTGPPVNRTFTGTYTLGNDGRGVLTFSSIAGSPTYAFAIDGTGAHGRLIEFDGSGTRGSGEIEKQSITACAFNTISGNYVIGTTGSAASLPGVTAGPLVLAGRFTATPPATAAGVGNLSNGEMDVNIPGISSTKNPILVSGTFQSTTQAGRCTLTAIPQQTLSSNFTYSVYPVQGSAGVLTEAFIVETDTVSSNTPYLTKGRLIQQSGYPFADARTSISGSSVASLTGQFLSGTTYVTDDAIVQLTGTSGTSFSMLATENQAGTLLNNTGALSGTFVNPDSFGRLKSNIGTVFNLVFYVYGPNAAVAIGETNNNPFYGIFQPQSGAPFSVASLGKPGVLVEGTSGPAISASRNLSGVFAVDGTSLVAGIQDESTTIGNTPAESVSGTYALTATGATNGGGTVTLTAPSAQSAVFFIVSPTKAVMLTTTNVGTANPDTQPVIIILGN
jgi:hypothetical protein